MCHERCTLDARGSARACGTGTALAKRGSLELEARKVGGWPQACRGIRLFGAEGPCRSTGCFPAFRFLQQPFTRSTVAPARRLVSLSRPPAVASASAKAVLGSDLCHHLGSALSLGSPSVLCPSLIRALETLYPCTGHHGRWRWRRCFERRWRSFRRGPRRHRPSGAA